MFKNIEILDLDDNLTKEEKRQILKLHMEANNITEASVQDSMHPKADVWTLHRDSIEEIINMDTERLRWVSKIFFTKMQQVFVSTKCINS
jgi:hypothetical protein